MLPEEAEERRIRDDQLEPFKIMEFLIMVEIFSIFFLVQEIYCQDRLQKLSRLINGIFSSIEKCILEINCFIRSKKSGWVKKKKKKKGKIKLYDFRKMVKK